ncbi:family 43 glycosylhydrolase [Verrucomicrobiaceae bacterium 5K15]|uniref:Family 43 glycosylhydrolase n=1 Tax=Oceaniferula flava TaxID=2800421 RepID=A0AAE2SFW3_9BACT|nr:family 43 glycosylhydrolase [Oceaniferula flavus]MBK1856232.1 family 43 glycosylhydrolase [Oceaniferula flavus]MBM1137539.1 family 43 glycosylhydrolase [Oceaniferula flavus]
MKPTIFPTSYHAWRHSGCAVLMCIVAVATTAANAQLRNEIKPGQVWNDTEGKPINAHGGCVIFHEGLYYWYGTHKIKGLSEKTHADGGFRCYSSKDLVNWKNEGMMLSLDRPEDEDLTHECNADRPKVIFNKKTRKFVMFFKLYLRGQGTKIAYTAVATSPDPTGPFTYRHKFLGGNSANGTGDFAMFKDDDGSLYHLAVRKPNKEFVIGKMRDDYLLPEGDYKVAKGITKHTEGPALLKHMGQYIMLASGSTGWRPNAARQFSADSITGPWTPAKNPVSGKNPHNQLGAKLTFGGQSNFILKVEGKENAFIAMFDINKPDHPYESGYIWLPITLKGSKMSIPWRDSWSLDVFK